MISATPEAVRSAATFVHTYLGAVSWRLWLVRLFQRSVGLLGLALLAMLILGVLRLQMGRPPVTPEIIVTLCVLAIPVLAILAASGVIGTGAAARWVDRKAGGKDRLTTAMALRGDSGGFGRAILIDAATFASAHPPRTVVPISPPRRTLWLLLPLILLVSAQLMFWIFSTQSLAERASAAEILGAAADVIKETDARSLVPVQEELLIKEQTVRETLVPNPAEAALEALSQAMSQVADVASRSGEADAASNSAAASFAIGLEASSNDDTTEPLPLGPDHVEVQSAGSDADGGRNLTQAELTELASRLDDLKRALRETASRDREAGEGTGEPGSVAAMSEGTAGSDKQGEGMIAPSEPSEGASPGDDEGTIPLVSQLQLQGPTAGPDDVAGRDQVDGTSVTLSVISSNSPGSASAAYRDAYREARRAAEEAVDREELPYGSRTLVRGYFERIRPKTSE